MPNSAGPTDPSILLVDNGSLAPAATLNLREIAGKLAQATGKIITPVSLLHSSAIPEAELGGQPAEIIEPAIEQRLRKGCNNFLIVPLFFGPSNALTDYLPRRLAALKEKRIPFVVRLAPPLVDLNQTTDSRIAQILEGHVRAKLADSGPQTAVVLVDHGSPVREVAAVRDFLAMQLQQRLGDTVRTVRAASMERRPGAHYAFSDPLLDHLLDQPDFNSGPIIIAMLFLSPGRHAGPNGDVMQIVSAAQKRHPAMQPLMTDLVGNHSGLIPILIDRLLTGMESNPL